MEIILGLILALIVFVMANMLFKVFNRPKVVPIDRRERPNAALLVIDMQEDFTRSEGKMAHNPDKRDAAIEQINALTAQAHKEGIPVIEVSHSFTDPIVKFVVRMIAGGAGNEGSEGLKRDEALTFTANTHIWKHETDGFTAPMLSRFLDDHDIGHLYLTGQDANACINATAMGALKRKYDVALIDDAILARNEKSWATKREKLIANGAKPAAGFAT